MATDSNSKNTIVGGFAASIDDFYLHSPDRPPLRLAELLCELDIMRRRPIAEPLFVCRKSGQFVKVTRLEILA